MDINKFKGEEEDLEEVVNPVETNQKEETNPNPETSETTETKENIVNNINTSAKEDKFKNNQNEIKLPKEEDDFDYNNPIKSYFEKVKIPTQEELKEKVKDLDIGSYGMFYCEKEYIGNFKCDQGDLLSCPTCMKRNQKLYNLNPKYLINHRGKVCTLKNDQMYCKGKYRKDVEVNGITYSYNYVCGHSGQCDGCKRLTQFVDKYYSPKLLEKLRQRKKK